jgi:hypothetical protein
VIIYSKFNSKPKDVHHQAAKRILRYLNGAKGLSVKLDGKLNGELAKSVQLTAYSDADWGQDPSVRKLFSGSIIKMNNCLIHWQSKQQFLVATSSTEA